MESQLVSVSSRLVSRPLLKWAGGKTQLLDNIFQKIPKQYNNYIEPFFGGGALFFALGRISSVIADSNPELINFYKTVGTNVEGIIECLKAYKNTEDFFYALRSQEWSKLSTVEAAARTLFLNRTCFNGLYRVNKKGHFNVPYGRYKNPKILDADSLRAASCLLQKTTIVCGDYKNVLNKYAKSGDLIFLDPPYLPVSEYSDFKRYTKEQFHEEDHVELASEVKRLSELGCHVILTNSNHPMVHELYNKFEIEVIQTKRHISSNARSRLGEDVIVSTQPRDRLNSRLFPSELSKQTHKYPSTRYMGSKSKLLSEIWTIASQFKFNIAVDLFSGSGVVGYMFKAQGKAVISNDYMAMSFIFSKAMVENNHITLSKEEAQELLVPTSRNIDHFVETTFKDLYFTDDDNQLIDIIRANIKLLKNEYKRAIAMSALIRACFKKRPRGIFTYIGHRYDDGRRDLALPFREQFIEAVEVINNAIFDNDQKNIAYHGDAMNLQLDGCGLIYLDPPYYSPYSDNEYVRRYHFVEGLARDWQGVEIQEHTITKKFKSYPTPFSTREGAAQAFDSLFKQFRDNILLVSYSSNSQPTLEEMVAILSKYKQYVDVLPIAHTYSFGNQSHKVGKNKNEVKEYLFVGY